MYPEKSITLFFNVRNLKTKSDNNIKDQYIIKTNNGEYLQSKGHIVVFIPFDKREKIALDYRFWDYSISTGKYRNRILKENWKQTKEKIDAGEYLLVNLNADVPESEIIHKRLNREKMAARTRATHFIKKSKKEL